MIHIAFEGKLASHLSPVRSVVVGIDEAGNGSMMPSDARGPMPVVYRPAAEILDRMAVIADGAARLGMRTDVVCCDARWGGLRFHHDGEDGQFVLENEAGDPIVASGNLGAALRNAAEAVRALARGDEFGMRIGPAAR